MLKKNMRHTNERGRKLKREQLPEKKNLLLCFGPTFQRSVKLYPEHSQGFISSPQVNSVKILLLVLPCSEKHSVIPKVSCTVCTSHLCTDNE